MSNKIVHVAVTQAEPAWLDLAAGVAKTCQLITEAAKNNAQLIAFPECWIPGYPCWIWLVLVYFIMTAHLDLFQESDILKLICKETRNRLIDVPLNVSYIKNSLRLDAPEMEAIKTCARTNSIAVSLGFSENDYNSLYIAQVLIGPDGEIKAHRRKMKPTHMERTIFGDASGECLSGVADLPFGRVGALSCWEHIQPLLKFHTFAQREDIHVAAWPSLTPHTGGADLWSMSAEG
jgi:predicted amidohydrolase